MKTKVRLNNGNEFIFDIEIKDFMRLTLQDWVRCSGDLYIKSNNICSIESI